MYYDHTTYTGNTSNDDERPVVLPSIGRIFGEFMSVIAGKAKKKNKRLILPVDGVPRRGPPELTLPPLRDAERRSRPETWPQYTQSGTHVRSCSFYVTIML